MIAIVAAFMAGGCFGILCMALMHMTRDPHDSDE